jgi:predicted nucleic acid-binding protein
VNLALDASVVCKWYLDEPLSDAARALAESDNQFIAPDFVLAECGNVLWLRLQSRDIGAKQAKEIARHLPGMFHSLVRSQDLLDRALEMAVALKHPLYDCMYLAVAERWDAPLVSADDKFLKAVRASEWAARVKPLRAYGAAG